MKRFQLEDLMEIMRTLRSENGCPWDREQTHESLRKYLLEESYEAVDAISRNQPAEMAEELGDVLLQVVFHAQLGAEAGTFTMDDVLQAICEKLISRHPHVFGDVHVKDADEVSVNWKQIKQEEHGIQTHTENLKAVPRSFPALMRAQKVQKRAHDAGFDFDSAGQAFEKLTEEVQELKTELSKNNAARLREELGDVLFSVVNVARFLKIDSEEALAQSTDKFVGRFSDVESAVLKRGYQVDQLPMAELDIIWEKSKKERK